MVRNLKLNELLTKGKSTDKPDPQWSPNNIKTVIISENIALIEHYTVEGSANGNWFESIEFDKDEQANGKGVLDPIFSDTGLAYTAIEEIVFICTPKYYQTCFNKDTDFIANIKSEISSKSAGDYLGPHPRLYAITCVKSQPSEVGAIVNCIKSLSAKFRQKNGVHYYDYFTKCKPQILIQDKTVRVEQNKSLLDQTWWKAGLYDDKLEKSVRVLRGWLYTIDANPSNINKDKPDSMPIYKALKRIGQPYLDAIQKDEEETAKAEATEKANSKHSSKDDAFLKTVDADYLNNSHLIFDIQKRRKEIYDLQVALYLFLNNISKNGALGEEVIKATSDYKSLVLFNGTLACNVYISDKRHANPTKQGYKSIVSGLDGNYLSSVTEAYGDLHKIAMKLNMGLKRYYMYNIGFQDSKIAYVKDACGAEGKTSADEKVTNILQQYCNDVYSGTNTFKQPNAVTEETKCTAEQMVQFIKVMFSAELLSAYMAFIRILPLNSVSKDFTDEIERIAMNQTKFGKDLIVYNDNILNIMKTASSDMHTIDWEDELKGIACASYKTGKPCETLLDYYERTMAIFDVITAFATRIMK